MRSFADARQDVCRKATYRSAARRKINDEKTFYLNRRAGCKKGSAR